MLGTNPLSHGSRWLKFWVPAGLLELYRNKNRARISREGWELRKEDTQFLLPVRTLGELFPGIESTELSIPVTEVFREDEWKLPLPELLTVMAICKYFQPRRVFEIGTYTGSSTLAMAMNTPSETEIYTLDLNPTERDTHRHGLGIGGLPAFAVGCLYQATHIRTKIHQLFGNAITYNYSSFLHGIDLVLIDADHTYEFVKADTDNAFQLLRPGGIIIWDDYLWNERHPECAGVTRCLNELRDKKPCFQIAGTRLAIYADSIQVDVLPD